MKKGFIYILSNNSLKLNLLKIGKTSKKTFDRSKQLSASTSIPEKFKVEDEFVFYDINWAERSIHKSLSKYRYNKKREFFICDLRIARQTIIEILIIDRQRQVDYLKNDINKYRNLIIITDFIKRKWESFFKKLNWKYEILNNEDKLLPNFKLETKKFLEYSNEEKIDSEFNLLDKASDIYIIPNLPNSDSEFGRIGHLQEITSMANKNNRLIIVSDKLIEDFSSLIFGWSYNFIHGSWSEVKFVNKDKKIGLLDEEEKLFCMITGELLERDNLYPDIKEMKEIWDA